MGSRGGSSKGCGDSLEWPPGTSCPVPMFLLWEQEAQAPFSVSLKDFGHVLGSNVQSMGCAFVVGLTPLSGGMW